jgi:hypothetical protein
MGTLVWNMCKTVFAIWERCCGPRMGWGGEDGGGMQHGLAIGTEASARGDMCPPRRARAGVVRFAPGRHGLGSMAGGVTRLGCAGAS